MPMPSSASRTASRRCGWMIAMMNFIGGSSDVDVIARLAMRQEIEPLDFVFPGNAQTRQRCRAEHASPAWRPRTRRRRRQRIQAVQGEAVAADKPQDEHQTAN